MAAMTTIDRATFEQVRHVALHMRQRDFIEFAATSPFDTRAGLADALAERYGGRDDVLCCSVAGEPICIGGTIEAWPNVVSLLFFATPSFPRVGLRITRFIRNELFPRYIDAGVHRIQAISLAGYDEVHDWLRTLGMEQEGGLLRAYGKGGEDFVQFARIEDVRAPGS